MSQKIQFRRGEEADRTSVVFDQGEPIWVIDTQQFYMGDGVTAGGQLISGGGGGSTTNGVTGISITGGISINGDIRVIGLGNVVTVQSGNTIIISGITTLPQLYVGSGNPEGIVSATSGSIYSDWFNKVQYNKFTGNFAYGWE